MKFNPSEENKIGHELMGLIHWAPGQQAISKHFDMTGWC